MLTKTSNFGDNEIWISTFNIEWHLNCGCHLKYSLSFNASLNANINFKSSGNLNQAPTHRPLVAHSVPDCCPLIVRLLLPPAHCTQTIYQALYKFKIIYAGQQNRRWHWLRSKYKAKTKGCQRKTSRVHPPLHTSEITFSGWLSHEERKQRHGCG
jgi:hypothetical protein